MAVGVGVGVKVAVGVGVNVAVGVGVNVAVGVGVNVAVAVGVNVAVAVAVAVGVGVNVAVGVGLGGIVGVAVEVAVAVAVGVGVGGGAPTQYLAPVLRGPGLPVPASLPYPPQTIISLSVATAVCRYRASGGLIRLVAIQLSVTGSYRPPVLR